jgi:hypothetical protein
MIQKVVLRVRAKIFLEMRTLLSDFMGLTQMRILKKNFMGLKRMGTQKTNFAGLDKTIKNLIQNTQNLKNRKGKLITNQAILKNHSRCTVN